MALHITSKEALAIVTSVRTWAAYLRFNEFEIQTDHQALRYIFKGQKGAQESQRLIRWSMYLAGFNFSIKFVAGDSPTMRQTDWLSRDSFVAMPPDERRQAMDMDPQIARQQEMNCPDCKVGGSGKVTANAAADGRDSNGATPIAADPKPQASIPVQPVAMETKTEPQTDGQPDPIQQEPANPEPQYKQIANFSIPKVKLLQKLEKYSQDLYPRDKLRLMQEQDKFGGTMIKYLESEELPTIMREARRLLAYADQYMIGSDQLLYHIEIPSGGLASEVFQLQLFAPEGVRLDIMAEAHSELHYAVDRLAARVKMKFYWPNMMGDLQRFIDQCQVCELDRKIRKPYTPKLKSPQVPSQPGLIWILDHVGSFHYSEGKTFGPKYVLVCVDAFSLWTELIPVKTTTALETAKALMDRVFASHSYPRAIRHDKGAGFTSKLLTILAKQLGIKQYIGSSMMARTQGIVERRIKTLSTSLRKLVNSRGGKWSEYIPSIQLALNMSPHRGLGTCPFFLQTGRMPNDPISTALISEPIRPITQREYMAELVQRVKTWRNLVRRNRQKYREQMEAIYNRKEHVPNDLTVGEMVYVHCPYLQAATGGIRRLNIPYRGPFVIIQIIQGRLCRLARVSDLTELPNLVSISRLKLTNMGIDPPRYQPDDELRAQDAPEVPDQQELLNERDVQQPWDQQEEDTQDREPEPEQPQPDPQPPETQRQASRDSVIVGPASIPRRRNDVPDNPENAEQSDQSSIPDEDSDDTDCTADVVWVRIAPRIRTTRQQQQDDGPHYREVARLLACKADKSGELLYKVLCKGDHVSQAFWTNIHALSGSGLDSMLRGVRQPPARQRVDKENVHLLMC